MAGGKQKKMLATLVGCNYAGTENELQGCINDVHGMHAVLLDRFSFAPDDITVLTDDHKTGVLPTGANVKRALSDMVARAAPGDVLFFHFSGHGTEDSPGRAKEAIVPCDLNLITDVDFQQLLRRVPRGATFTMVADSCFSGGLFDQEKEQIGPNGGAADRHLLRAGARGGRYLPYSTVLAHLSAASGMDASHHVGVHLVALFGDDASAKFQSHSHSHPQSHDHHRHGHSSSSGAGGAHAGVLLSGSQKDETSADMPGHDGKPPCGAFTDALQTVLKAHPAPMSNRELVRRAREEVRRASEELGESEWQHPCLYCSDANADAPFLGQHACMTPRARASEQRGRQGDAMRAHVLVHD